MFLDHITKREKEIIKLLANGFTNSIIAKTLHIAENTVKVHRKNILQKAISHKLHQNSP